MSAHKDCNPATCTAILRCKVCGRSDHTPEEWAAHERTSAVEEALEEYRYRCRELDATVDIGSPEGIREARQFVDEAETALEAAITARAVAPLVEAMTNALGDLDGLTDFAKSSDLGPEHLSYARGQLRSALASH